MELLELKQRIIKSFKGQDNDLAEILEMVEKDRSIFPFNEYEHLICTLIDRGGMTYIEYIQIRSDYISQNPNLWIFEISAPRGFGEKFAQTYVLGKSSNLKPASKALDKDYVGQYDLRLDDISIEVKASRAVDSDSDEPLYIKALARNTTKNFLMNFQQLKPQCCDVFIWVAVFRDQIVLWVLNSQEVQLHPLFSKGQHRGNAGNEGQLHINQDNIQQFDKYALGAGDLDKAIRDAFERLKTSE